MKIDVAERDVIRLRRLVFEKHEQIMALPVVVNDLGTDPLGMAGTREDCLHDANALRKLHRRLTRAARRIYGHDCHPEQLTRLNQCQRLSP